MQSMIGYYALLYFGLAHNAQKRLLMFCISWWFLIPISLVFTFLLWQYIDMCRIVFDTRKNPIYSDKNDTEEKKATSSDCP